MGRCNGCKRKRNKCCCRNSCYSSCGNSCYSSCGSSCNSCCKTYDCVKTRCGFISLVLNVVAAPTTYTAAGEVIVFTYSVTNLGTDYFSGCLTINSTLLGDQFLTGIVLAPGLSQNFTRNYTITAADVLLPSLTITSYVKATICGKCLCYRAPATVLTRV